LFSEICQQRGQALIQLRQLAVHDLKVLLVRVPALVVDGDEGDAFFDKPPCHETALTKGVASIAVTHFLLFLAKVEELPSIPEDEFIGLLFGIDDGFQRRAFGAHRQQRVDGRLVAQRHHGARQLQRGAADCAARRARCAAKPST